MQCLLSFLYLCVFVQVNSKSYGLIWTKFSGSIDFVVPKTRSYIWVLPPTWRNGPQWVEIFDPLHTTAFELERPNLAW